MLGFSDADVALLRSLIEIRMHSEGFSDPESIRNIHNLGTTKLAGTPEASVFVILKQIVAGVNQGKLLATVLQDIERVRGKAQSDPGVFTQVLAIARAPGAEAGQAPAAYCMYRLSLEHPGRLTGQNLDNAFSKIFSHLTGFEAVNAKPEAAPPRVEPSPPKSNHGPVRQATPIPAMHPGDIALPVEIRYPPTAEQAVLVDRAVDALLARQTRSDRVTPKDISNAAPLGYVFSDEVINYIDKKIKSHASELGLLNEFAPGPIIHSAFCDGRSGKIEVLITNPNSKNLVLALFIRDNFDPSIGGSPEELEHTSNALADAGITTITANVRGNGRSDVELSALVGVAEGNVENWRAQMIEDALAVGNSILKGNCRIRKILLCVSESQAEWLAGPLALLFKEKLALCFIGVMAYDENLYHDLLSTIKRHSIRTLILEPMFRWPTEELWSFTQQKVDAKNDKRTLLYRRCGDLIDYVSIEPDGNFSFKGSFWLEFMPEIKRRVLQFSNSLAS